MTESNSLTSLCRSIEEELLRDDVRPEDIERRTRLLQPLEREVALLPKAPVLPDGTGARIAISVWSKKHPNEADVESLIALLRDERPLVRALAADAVEATLSSSHSKWHEPRFSYQARQILLEQREVEDSPVIGYQLQQLTERLGRMTRQVRQARPKVRINPYVAGLPVRDASKFVGREDVLSEIRSTLGKRAGIKSIVLHGARRTGKTSVLYRIQGGALGPDFIPVYLDMQAFAGTQVSNFLVALVRATETALKNAALTAGPGLYSEETDLTFYTLQQFFHQVLSQLDGRCLLLLIDEYEVLQEYLKISDLALQFQHLFESEPALFAVFAGSQKLEALRANSSWATPLLDVARYIKISFLKPQEAMRLIVDLAQGALSFAPGVPEQILYLTGRHPFYTQLLCQSLFDLVEGGAVNLAHVDQVVRQFLQNPSPHLILTWNSMGLREKVVGSTLAALQNSPNSWASPEQILDRLRDDQYPTSLRRGEVHQALGGLLQIDWVEKNEGEGYRFTMELVRRWVTENRTILTLAEEERMRVLAQAPSYERQFAARAIDFVVPSILSLGVISILETFVGRVSTMEAIGVFGMWALIYFLGAVGSGECTMGQRFVHLRPLTSFAVSLDGKQKFVYGVLLLLRFAVAIGLLYFTARSFTGGGWHTILGVIAALAVGADHIRTAFAKHRQGLYEKLASVVLVRIGEM